MAAKKGEFVTVGEEAVGEKEGGVFGLDGLDMVDAKVGVVVFYGGRGKGSFGGGDLGGVGVWHWESMKEVGDLGLGLEEIGVVKRLEERSQASFNLLFDRLT
ncbi:MAG: hypothetical protein HLUCCA11_05315 [Phormidesmis priestleyi Ana]|uniref:Uncharacterized protein n=1 Tax=Phormidesmis priestleyi Ana TaxID=1666911 RepID=A0A0P7ZNE7_9CYAN|nr:MAG: hypothetical protein HLUCCA11_05315 [Phormidesmis priestleyi Ana]